MLKKVIFVLGLLALFPQAPAWAASPAIRDTNTSVSTADSTTQAVAMPATVVAGDTLVTFLGCDGNHSGDASASGWTHLKRISETADNFTTLNVLYKKAAGSEGGTNVNFTITNSESCGHASASISGAADPTVTAPEVSAGAHSTTGAPDSDSLTPAAGSKEYLFISAGSGDGGINTCSAAPTNYSNLLSAENTDGTNGTQG